MRPTREFLLKHPAHFLALGFGADPSFRAPMAIAVIGGLITSTLLSLLVVPAVFTYIDDLQQVLRRVLRLRPHASVGMSIGAGDTPLHL